MAALGAGAQVALEVADVGVRGGLGQQLDVAALVEVDAVQRAVDDVDALADALALAVEMGLEVGHLADGVLVEQRLEARLEAGQVVVLQARQHGARTRRRRPGWRPSPGSPWASGGRNRSWR
ncbi:MAG: hypothetical protein U5L11_10570 [Arhodomonas sp.]|nr:hypothetical protein [Arhodomonas sp.]